MSSAIDPPNPPGTPPRPQCAMYGCDRPAREKRGIHGPEPKYCNRPGHNAKNKHKQQQRARIDEHPVATAVTTLDDTTASVDPSEKSCPVLVAPVPSDPHDDVLRPDRQEEDDQWTPAAPVSSEEPASDAVEDRLVTLHPETGGDHGVVRPAEDAVAGIVTPPHVAMASFGVGDWDREPAPAGTPSQPRSEVLQLRSATGPDVESGLPDAPGVPATGLHAALAHQIVLLAGALDEQTTTAATLAMQLRGASAEILQERDRVRRLSSENDRLAEELTGIRTQLIGLQSLLEVERRRAEDAERRARIATVHMAELLTALGSPPAVS